MRPSLLWCVLFLGCACAPAFDTPTVPAHSAPGAGAAADPDAFVQMVSGMGHSCGLRADGGVWCWGDNRAGELGLGPEAPTLSVAKRRVSGLAPTASLAAGAHHTCALLPDGAVSCWGAGWQGQLGDGRHEVVRAPTPVLGIDDAQLITAGEEHTCVLREGSQTVACWGSGRSGQLGPEGVTMGKSSLPLAVADGRGVVQLVSARATTCARTGRGRVSCWGGWDGAPMPERSRPAGPRKVSHLSADPRSICALGSALGSGHRGEGGVTCWDANALDRAIDDPELLAPVDGPAALGGLARHCVIDEQGRAQCWRAFAWSDTAPVEAVPLPAGARVLSVTYGQRHACASLATGETLCWGDNALGQLGGARVTAPTANPWAQTAVRLVDDRFTCGPGLTRAGEAGVEQWCVSEVGQRHGPSRRHHPNGQIAESGRFESGHREGTWESWGPHGERRTTGTYSAGQRHGPWALHAGPSDQAGWRGVYGEDRPEGRWRFATDAGVVLRELDFQDGAQRRWLICDAQGRPQQRLEATDAGYTWTAWEAQGGRREVEVLASGRPPDWSLDDAAWKATLLTTLVMDGDFRRYEAGEILVEQGRHERRLREGTWRRWSPGGGLLEETEYAADHRHGRSREWYEDGQPRHDGHYQRGVQDGPWTRWYADGQLRSQGALQAGRAVGTWNRWHTNGQLRERRDHERGRFSTWYEDGQRRAQGQLAVQADLPTRDPSSLLVCLETLETPGALAPSCLGVGLGLPHGRWRLWWQDGTLAASGRYAFGRPLGAWRYWREDGTRLGDPCDSKALDEMFAAEGAGLGCGPTTPAKPGF